MEEILRRFRESNPRLPQPTVNDILYVDGYYVEDAFLRDDHLILIASRGSRIDIRVKPEEKRVVAEYLLSHYYPPGRFVCLGIFWTIFIAATVSLVYFGEIFTLPILTILIFVLLGIGIFGNLSIIISEYRSLKNIRDQDYQRV